MGKMKKIKMVDFGHSRYQNKTRTICGELLLNFCFHNISNNDVLINGISVSPKINNCIFKIWNKNKENNDINF